MGMWKVIAGIAAMGALVGVGSVAAGPNDNEPATPGMTVGVGVLSKTPTDADRLPEAAATEIRSLAPARTDVADSIKAQTRTDAGDVYLTPTPEGACVSLAGPDSAAVQCLRTDELVHRSGEPTQMFGLTGCRKQSAESPVKCANAVLYGVVPDGVRRVSVDVAGGLVGDVENNVYVVEVPEDQALAKVTHH
jgi:hypothetical protein